jgi:hypothetical protein
MMTTINKGESVMQNLVTVKDGKRLVETRYGTKTVYDWLVCPHVADVELGGIIVNQNVVCCHLCSAKLMEITEQSGEDAKNKYMDNTFIKTNDPIFENIIRRNASPTIGLFICEHLDNPADLAQYYFNQNPITWWTLDENVNIISCGNCLESDVPVKDSYQLYLGEEDFISRVIEPLCDVNNYIASREIALLQ